MLSFIPFDGTSVKYISAFIEEEDNIILNIENTLSFILNLTFFF